MPILSLTHCPATRHCTRSPILNECGAVSSSVAVAAVATDALSKSILLFARMLCSACRSSFDTHLLHSFGNLQREPFVRLALSSALASRAARARAFLALSESLASFGSTNLCSTRPRKKERIRNQMRPEIPTIENGSEFFFRDSCRRGRHVLASLVNHTNGRDFGVGWRAFSFRVIPLADLRRFRRGT